MTDKLFGYLVEVNHRFESEMVITLKLFIASSLSEILELPVSDRQRSPCLSLLHPSGRDHIDHQNHPNRSGPF